VSEDLVRPRDRNTAAGTGEITVHQVAYFQKISDDG